MLQAGVQALHHHIEPVDVNSLAHARRYAPADPGLDWGKFMEAKHKELHRLNDAYGKTLGKAGVETYEGRAKLLDPHTVEVSGKQITAKYILLAVGGTPTMIGLPGVWPGAE
jgi:pyruvate/2-oxoglutarate dehydrogenase complex dihydrolipoamide dehydrogenase (E3) component